MYTGKIINNGVIKDVDRIVTNGSGKALDLQASLRVVNHSPTGFCWGYSGSGPAQLSLAILLDYFDGDRERALSLYQDFKFEVISNLPMDEDFILTDEQVDKVVTKLTIKRMQEA